MLMSGHTVFFSINCARLIRNGVIGPNTSSYTFTSILVISVEKS